MMNRLISASGPKEVLSLLSTSKYNFYMDDKEFAYIEYYADSIQYNIAKDTCVFQTVHHLFI